jgi:hypothetical protein
MSRAVKTAAVSLTQEEANLVLRGLELLGEMCAAIVHQEPGRVEIPVATVDVKIIDKVWNKVFDAGLERGFGALPKEQTGLQAIDVFDLPEEVDVTGSPV